MVDEENPSDTAALIRKSPFHHVKKASVIAKDGYNKAMPARKSHRVILWFFIIMITLIIAAQLLYPANKSLPFAKINGRPSGFKDYQVLAGSVLEDFEKTKIEIITNEGGKKVFRVREAGAQLKTENLVMRTQDYSIRQRLIPLSILFKRPDIREAEIYFFTPVLEKFSEDTNEELSTKAVNATFAIKDGELVATRDKDGSEVTAEQIQSALALAKPRLGQTTKVSMKTKPTRAEVTSEQFSEVRNQAELALENVPRLVYEERVFTPSKKDVASWLVLQGGSSKELKLALNKKGVEGYIAGLNQKIGVAAGTTAVSIVDGKEKSRRVGKDGRAVDGASLLAKLEDFIIKDEDSGDIEITTYVLKPRVVYSRSYTSSQAGLQAYLSDVGAAQNVRVSVRQLGGGGWSAGTRESESTVSASTYKLYVALMLFDKMQSGQTKWDSKMLDTTVSGCFDRMIIASTNQCSETWLAQWGEPNVDRFVRSKGFSGGTSFTNPLANHTTAGDLTRLMSGLHSGSLVSGAHRNRLLSGLSSHHYKDGIPAGTRARTVYNKVGFLWDYSNDTAIVHHPRGTYVITVLTKGYGFWKVAEITREVEKLMYP